VKTKYPVSTIENIQTPTWSHVFCGVLLARVSLPIFRASIRARPTRACAYATTIENIHNI
jgi:hypothetical protein